MTPGGASGARTLLVSKRKVSLGLAVRFLPLPEYLSERQVHAPGSPSTTAWDRYA